MDKVKKKLVDSIRGAYNLKGSKDLHDLFVELCRILLILAGTMLAMAFIMWDMPNVVLRAIILLIAIGSLPLLTSSTDKEH